MSPVVDSTESFDFSGYTTSRGLTRRLRRFLRNFLRRSTSIVESRQLSHSDWQTGGATALKIQDVEDDTTVRNCDECQPSGDMIHMLCVQACAA